MSKKELNRKIGELWIELVKTYNISREELEDLLDELEDIWENWRPMDRTNKNHRRT